MTSLSNSSMKYRTEIFEETRSEEQREMECLLESLPVLNSYFQLHSKIGQGTFSTVYLATLRNSSSTQKYAVKHLTQTCEPSRIENELRCLQEIGGKDNVVPAELCLTNGKNCVTFIMPYLAHRRFSDYVFDMDAEETCFYMKNLFIALKRVHSFNIIHRDVKPNNFLYNRETKQFLLVDFGLAQLVRIPNQEISRATTSFDENKPIDFSKKRKRLLDSSEDENKGGLKGNKRIALKSKDNNVKITPVSKTTEEMKIEMEKGATKEKDSFNSPVRQDAEEIAAKAKTLNCGLLTGSKRRVLDTHSASTSGKMCSADTNSSKSRKSTETSLNSFTPLVSSKSPSGNFFQIKNSRVVRQHPMSSDVSLKGVPTASPPPACPCSGRGAVCSLCSSRQPMFAPRAGTSGFRPPEVLLKYLHQTTAVDMWASGVVMLCILSGCYPFFNSSTDLASLAEIMTIFGTEPTIKVAKKFGRRIFCSEQRKAVDLKKLCTRLRARSLRKSGRAKSNSSEPKCRDCLQTVKKDGCLCRSDGTDNEAESDYASHQFPDSAYDLLYRLLDLDPSTRITAAEALEHPFITGNQHVSNKGLLWRGSAGARGTGNGSVLAAGSGDLCETDALTEVAVSGGDKLEGSDSTADDAVHLKRRLGLFSGVALIVGTMIGSGIFVSPSGLLIRTGSVGMSFVIWIACGLLSLLGALAYAELGTMNTSSGAEYAYFMDAFGPMPAFLFSWASTLVLKPSQMAIICLSFAKYAVEAFVAECEPPDAAVKAVSVLAIVIILFINCYSVNLATGVQNVFTAAKLIAIMIVILGGLYKLIQGNTQHLENVFHGSTFSFGNIAIAFYTGLWAYDGWNNLNYVTEEIKNPSRNLPMSIIIAIPLVTACYVLINISYLAVMSAAEMIESEAVAVTFGNRILGVMSWLIPLSVTVSTFGSANGTLFAAGRLCFAASREGHLMNILSYVHIRRFTPAPGLIFHSLIAVAMVLSGTIDSLIDFFSFTAWIFYGGAMLALIVMRYTKPDYPRPYKVPIIIPAVVLVISLYLIVAPIIDVPQIEYLYAAFFIVGGLIFYVPFVYYGVHCKVMDRFTVFCQLLLEVAPTQVMFDST